MGITTAELVIGNDFLRTGVDDIQFDVPNRTISGGLEF